MPVADEDFVAYVPGTQVFHDPFGVGDVVLAAWPIGVARVLARLNAQGFRSSLMKIAFTLNGKPTNVDVDPCDAASANCCARNSA